MLLQPDYDDAFFIFNDNETQFISHRDHPKANQSCSPGAGNGVIRPFQCESPPRASGIPTGDNGQGYTVLTPHVKTLIDQAIASIRKQIADQGYRRVYFSADKHGSLGGKTFTIATEVKDYIVSQIQTLAVSADTLSTHTLTGVSQNDSSLVVASLSPAVSSSAIVDGKQYKLMAFYYPGRKTDWDNYYHTSFLANFYVCPVSLTIDGVTGNFHNAEAAFQATKWWDRKDTDGQLIRPQFEACKYGNDAFQLRSRLAGSRSVCGEVPDWDHSYVGLGREGVMLAVVASKFMSEPLKTELIATGDAYLLEHNMTTDRDDFWSDNHDGKGQNKLGKMLMKLRHRLGGLANPAEGIRVAEFTRQVQTV